MNVPYSMPVPKTEKSRSLKLRLDKALLEYRSKVPLWPKVDLEDPDYELKIDNLVDLTKARKDNPKLKYYCLLGNYLDLHPEKYNPHYKPHVIGSFLYKFFGQEEDAIDHLVDVTPHSIYYTSAQDCDIILLLKPDLPTPQSPAYEPEAPDWSVIGDFESSLNDSPAPQHPLRTGELWYDPPNSSLLRPVQPREDTVEPDHSYDCSYLDPTTTRDLSPSHPMTSPFIPTSLVHALFNQPLGMDPPVE